jgi:TolB-like protein
LNYLLKGILPISQVLKGQEHHHSAKLPISSDWEVALYLFSENYQRKEKEGLAQCFSESITSDFERKYAFVSLQM